MFNTRGWNALGLLSAFALPVVAQSFRVQCPDSTSTHPATLHDNNSEPAYRGPTTHYRGRLLDGTEFDNSDSHAQAATFSVNSVIKGWREALLLMKRGAKWRLFVPPELGHDLNSPPNIPPASLLIFDLELVKVESASVLSGPALKGQKGAKPPAARAPAKPAAGQ